MAKAMTAADRRHVERVVSMHCIVCRNEGLGESEAEYHHVRFLGSMGKRAPHKAGIPLCPAHHRTGGKGVAYHAAPWTFEAVYGTEEMLLRQTYEELGEEYPY